MYSTTEYALTNELDLFVEPGAPLCARYETIIRAPIRSVWQLVADLERWPTWQPEVQRVVFDGPLTPGVPFHWNVAGVKVHSLLGMVKPPHKIGWTAVSPGLRAIHIWHFEEHPKGTLAITEESLSGWLARLLRITQPNKLENALMKAMLTLKREAERRIIPT
ncbi:MAG: hypothetical protein OHK0046_51040 [Anaerolineae bacterium]